MPAPPPFSAPELSDSGGELGIGEPGAPVFSGAPGPPWAAPFGRPAFPDLAPSRGPGRPPEEAPAPEPAPPAPERPRGAATPAQKVRWREEGTPQLRARLCPGPGASRIVSVGVDCLARVLQEGRGAAGAPGAFGDALSADWQDVPEGPPGLPRADYAIVDSRWPYEYEGGHVLGAANLFCESQLAAYFFGQELRSRLLNRAAVPHTVFLHCEYSRFRAPRLAAAFLDLRSRFLDGLARCGEGGRAWAGPVPGSRAEDPRAPGGAAPGGGLREALYPQVFVVEGGYQAFHDRYGELCAPPGYVPEADPGHARSMLEFRRRYYPELGGGLEEV